MILYHAISSYHLLNAILHKLSHKEAAILVISEWIPEKFPNSKELEKFFDKVIVMDAIYAFFHTDQETEAYVRSIVGELQRYSELYLWGAHYTMGYYFARKKIPFIYAEDGAGLLSRPQILRGIEVGVPLKKHFYEQLDALGLYDGTAESITRILCNVSAQSSDFRPSEKVVDFNVVKELSRLPEAVRAPIQAFFIGGKRISIDENVTVLLTQHFASLQVMNFEQQVLIYQLLVDYFFADKKLMIKPHPDDVMYYSRLFPGVPIVREKFPSEFMPFIFDHTPAGVATISSTAIYNLRGCFRETFELDSRYEKDFAMTHRYYAAVKLAQTLGLVIVCHGANERQVVQLGKTLSGKAPAVLEQGEATDVPYMLLVDDVTEQGETGRKAIQARVGDLRTDSCVVFINSQQDYCWYAYEQRSQWSSILPVVLKKRMLEAAGEDFYASVEDEVIYLYSQNKEMLTMAKETKIYKELPHTGIAVEKCTLTPEQEKIKMLEGILAATERCLLYYIEKENKAE